MSWQTSTIIFSVWAAQGCKFRRVIYYMSPAFIRQDNNCAPDDIQAEFPELVFLSLTSGERRVQLLVEDALLPVLLLLSDIALFRLNSAQHGADSAFMIFCRRRQKQRVFIEYA